MSDNVVEDTVVDDNSDDYEIIKMSRIIEIAKGTVPEEQITETEQLLADVLMEGYKMGMEDIINNVEAKIEASINSMKNDTAVSNEIDVEVNADVTENV